MSRIPPALSEYTITVLAGGSETIPISGGKVRVLSADVDFKISFNDGRTLFAAAGLRYQAVEGERFNRVTIHAPSGAPVTASISVADGLVDDDRVIFVGNSLNVDLTAQTLTPLIVRQNGPLTYQHVSTLLANTGVPANAFANNATRARAYLFNTHAVNFVDVRHDNAAGTGGVRLMPETGQWFETTDALWVYQNSGAGIWINRAQFLW